MKIQVHRDACCSQDDQMGPLDMSYELPDDCTLGDLIEAVRQSRFLQFSSTHTDLSCRIAGEQVAMVFSPYAEPVRAPRYGLPAGTLVRSIAIDRGVEFVFERV